VESLPARVPADRLFLNPSCSLLHVPIDMQLEEDVLDPRLMEWLAFAEQKLIQIATLTECLEPGQAAAAGALQANARAVDRRRHSDW
jgi:5-methyltetrahydropteroyltriglutamate--homocysteine methyltransferase